MASSPVALLYTLPSGDVGTGWRSPKYRKIEALGMRRECTMSGGRGVAEKDSVLPTFLLKSSLDCDVRKSYSYLSLANVDVFTRRKIKTFLLLSRKTRSK